jgi:hypothetical protein
LLGRARRFFVPLGLSAVAAFSADLGHVGAVTADRLSALSADLRHVLTIFAHGRSALPSDFGHVSSITTDRFAAFAADLRHMATILANGHSTFSTRFSGLLGRKLMRPALDVGGFSPLARDLALPLLIHRGESAPRLFRHDTALLICPFRREANEVPLRKGPCAGFRRVKCPKRLQEKHASAGTSSNATKVGDFDAAVLAVRGGALPSST